MSQIGRPSKSGDLEYRKRHVREHYESRRSITQSAARAGVGYSTFQVWLQEVNPLIEISISFPEDKHDLPGVR